MNIVQDTIDKLRVLIRRELNHIDYLLDVRHRVDTTQYLNESFKALRFYYKHLHEQKNIQRQRG